MKNEMIFSDCIEILTSAYDSTIYSPAINNQLGLYLYNDNEKPIKYMTLIDSRLTLYYADGSEKMLEDLIMSINVDESRFKRRTKMSVQGNLLKFDTETAELYNLDMTKAFPKEVMKYNTRKRSL